MFDVGFSELMVIGVVALLVLGPEKLPRVARTIGALMGRAQRYVNDVKADISREIELDELKKLKASVTEAAQGIESSVRETVAGFEAQAAELNNSIAGGAEPAAAPPPEAPAEALAAADESIRAALAVSDPVSIAPAPAQASLALDDPQPVASAPGAKAG